VRLLGASFASSLVWMASQLALPIPPRVGVGSQGPIPLLPSTGIGRSPHDDSVGLLGLIGTPGWVCLAC
jgi:hypothetical protein